MYNLDIISLNTNNELRPLFAATPSILYTAYYSEYESFDVMNLLYLYILSFFVLQYYHVIVRLYHSADREIEYQADGLEQQILNKLFPRPATSLANSSSQDTGLQLALHSGILVFVALVNLIACINTIVQHSGHKPHSTSDHMHFMFMCAHSIYVLTHGLFTIKPIIHVTQSEASKYTIKWTPQTGDQNKLLGFYAIQPVIGMIANYFSVLKVASFYFNWLTYYSLAGYDAILKNGLIIPLEDNRQRIIVRPWHQLRNALPQRSSRFTFEQIPDLIRFLQTQDFNFLEQENPMSIIVDTPALPEPIAEPEQPRTNNLEQVYQSAKLSLLYSLTFIASAYIMTTMTAMSALTICSLLFGMAFLMFEHLITRVNFHLYDFSLFEHNGIIPTPSSMVHNYAKQAKDQVALTVGYFKPSRAPQ